MEKPVQKKGNKDENGQKGGGEERERGPKGKKLVLGRIPGTHETEKKRERDPFFSRCLCDHADSQIKIFHYCHFFLLWVVIVSMTSKKKVSVRRKKKGAVIMAPFPVGERGRHSQPANYS